MRRILSVSGLLLLTACATTSPPAITPEQPSPEPATTPIPASTPVPAVTPTPVPVVTPVPVTTPTPQRKPPSEAEARALLNRLLPAQIKDRDDWNADILDAFTALKIPYTAEHFCAAAAVIEQESSWQGDPVVPGLDRIVWKEIEEKADRFKLPMVAVRTALLKPSPDGRSYKERIDTLRTEREMNALYQDLAREARSIGLPIAQKNPIRTGGPMQVSVAFAESHVNVWPYPYPRRGSVRDEVFTRRGGTYFGIAILLQYPAPYGRDMVYYFADFNAGRYASRNAAFQAALNQLTGGSMDLDGDLLRYENGQPSRQPSSTLLALGKLAPRLGLSPEAMQRDLQQEKTVAFGSSPTWQKVFALADQQAGKALPRARIPQIDLKSPKITRKLTTEWFANRVKGRFDTCMARQ
ncbi:DUF1615 domain-containing protein [Chitinilyticum piscinae]|uniref:DUF1615 domain-containing protein n=1 Tax=Chitinilyticum piscinae TaxID=2866724 RepID=A0A8J7K1L0_9NEIS|nr:DUF1615 domain-containing protein [Chitinilyticum piscinae]MBE9609371.1 DUF1615 domain-containing protein [Chitinilyticum piscinae]